MQYPTIGQPQYGFAPTMPGMASGGLASLPVKKFQSGGFSIGTAPAQSGFMDTAFSPIAGSPVVNTPFGPVGITPANLAAAVAPPVAPALGLIGLGRTAYGMMMGKQAPAPIMEAKTAAEVEAQQAQMDATIAAAQDAEDAEQGLAMMNQMQAQPEQNVSPVDVAATVAATADAVDAEAGAANAAAAQGPGAMDQGIGGVAEAMGGGDGSTPGAPGNAPSIGGSMDAGGSNDSGNDAGTDGASPSNKQGGLIRNYRYGGQIMNYEQGGLAAAQQAQSAGRGQDTMLVHMTPGEVKGLQALAMSQGGSLTINPQTGLPEAGFLSKMLPMIAGMALAPLTAGTSLAFLGATPLASALTVGSLTGLATGSLKKGLMAGLGAYGGAGIGQGMSAAAGTAENLAAAAPTTPYNPDLLTTYGPTPGITPTPTPDVSSFAGSAGDFGGIPSVPAGPVPGSGYAGSLPSGYPFKNITYGDTGQALGSVAKDTTFAQLPPPPPIQPTGMDAFTGGTKAMLQPGDAGTAARSAFMKGAPTGSLMAAGTTLASALTPEPAPLEKSKTFIRPFSLEVENLSGQDPYTSGDTRERRQVRYAYKPEAIYEAAQGGQIDSDYNMAVGQNGAFSDAYKEGGLSALDKRRKSLSGDKYYKFADSRRDQSMEAAIEQNFAKGGLPPRFLSGGGDGMSDSIKARIGGVQEARLADGEFVVPADVVSHLGNGSSKAGAKKLYAMMDKIRKARTGRTRQAPEVNPNKYMPA